MRIEERLKQLADENPNYSLLWAQWEFDKRLLTRALTTISRDFPHYSLHDASHSSTIITQIEKIISPDVEKLSATDCWLLLEACYWHDAGMIITNDEKKALLASDSFKIHLEQLAESQHELSSYAKAVIYNEALKGLENILHESNALTFLISDYYRSLHADRSGGHVLNPMGIKISSPRTTLIPQRFFNFVAEIVQCHGKKRTEILNLAKQNDGMDANDYSHPRYIAALLRIGDLLDIDDGRFCPTLLENIGEIPPSSLDHQHKHASIKHLLINHEVIDIKAECVEYGGYKAQKAWFDYIQDEFDYQKRVWNKIVPESSYRALPTIENLDCSIKGYIAIKGKVPSISLDSKRVYDYITGAQLYSEKYPFVREIIQNAIDATYYQCWEELTEEVKISDYENSELREKFEKILSEKKIQVRLEEAYNKNKSICNDKGTINYKFSVQDYATGMSLDDLAKLLNVGSESIMQRKTTLKVMPDWAKPSGFFGIGFQTVLKMCNRVVITTKKIDNPCYELEVNKDKNELYEITIKVNNSIRKNGTYVSAYFDYPFIPTSVSSAGFDILHGFDPLVNDKLVVVPEYIRHEIDKNFTLSPVKIYFNDVCTNDMTLDDNGSDQWFPDYEAGADFNLIVNSDLNSRINFLYKGVIFDSNIISKGVVGSINIFSKDAGYWLMMDRKKGRNDKRHELISMINTIIENNFEFIKEQSPNKSAADFYGFAVLNNNGCTRWEEYSILGGNIGEYLLRGVPLSISSGNPHGAELEIPSLDVSETAFDYIIAVRNRLNISCEVKFVKDVEYDIHGRKQKAEIHSLNFINDKKNNISIDVKIIQGELNPKKMGLRGRMVIPLYDKKYEKISIEANDLPLWVSKETAYSELCNKFLFLPFRSERHSSFNYEDEKDISLIYDFYARNNLTKIDESKFKSLYQKYWKELGGSH